jgi:hypothetical protein
LLLGLAASVALAAGLLVAKAGISEAFVLGMTFYAPFALGLVVMSGLVSDERATGLIVLWLQKPTWLSRTYSIRYALYLLLLSVVTLVLGLIIGALGVVGDLFPIAKALRLIAAMLALALVPAAMVFAFSAWGVRRDAVFAFLAVVIGISLAGVTSFDRSTASAVIKLFAFPLDPIMTVISARSHPLSQTRAIAIIAAQLAGWSLLGFLGLRFAERLLQRN